MNVLEFECQAKASHVMDSIAPGVPEGQQLDEAKRLIAEALREAHARGVEQATPKPSRLRRTIRRIGWRGILRYFALGVVVLLVSFSMWVRVVLDVQELEQIRRLQQSNDHLADELKDLNELLMSRMGNHL